MAASAAYSNPHVLAHTLRFSVRRFLALKKHQLLEVPIRIRDEWKVSEIFAGFYDTSFGEQVLMGIASKNLNDFHIEEVRDVK